MMIPCIAAPAQEPQPPQWFKEKVEKSAAEFEAQKEKSKANFEAQKQKNQAEFEAQKEKNRAEFEARKQNGVAEFEAQKQKNKAEYEANVAQMRADSERNRKQMTSEFYKWATFLVIFGIASSFFKYFLKRNRYGRKNQTSNEQAILDAGKEGEKETAFHLSFLPKEYAMLHNITVRSNGLSAQNDHIVIGFSGIILIETKNYGGTIYVRPNGWVREKYGKKEGCTSPIAQSERHKAVVENFLNKNGFGEVPVHIVVAISNSRTIVEGEDPRCPVLKSEDLMYWIKQLPSAISEEQIAILHSLFASQKQPSSGELAEVRMKSI